MTMRGHTPLNRPVLLNSFKWKIFPHPTYSPDLAPSDYHLFPYLKRSLGGVHFTNDAELKTYVTNFLKNLDGTFYA